MTARGSDRLLGLILILVSALWCWGVVQTIPGIDDGSRLGARGFPLGLGLLLGGLGLIVLVQTIPGREDPEPETDAPAVPRKIEIWAVCVTVGLLAGYAALLEYTGFLIATFLITLIAVGPALRVWRPGLIAGMALGLSVGIYLVFGKLLGVYLPHGSLTDLSF
jgi:hypothetical protein